MIARAGAWVRRDPGLACLVAALVLATLIYLPVVGRGLVNYDDPWLVGGNWILSNPSLASLRAVALDLGADTRFALGAEYLPVRDLSVMLDHLVWGTWYGGHHLTSLVLYLAAIAAWFHAFAAFGIERRVAGLAALIWAVLPSHAESVAWLAERKGVLAALFAGLCALGYARFRGGASARWLVLAIVSALAAVWSKAPAAFAIAALAGLELVLPGRASWRRSLAALAAIGGGAALAFVPVLMVAVSASVVDAQDHATTGWPEMALGLHGFYLRLAALAIPSSVSYPIATAGPGGLDLVLGAVGLVAVLAALLLRRSPPALRAGALLWLVCFFPVSRLVLPLKAILVADRYLLLPTLGLALATSVGIWRIAGPRLRALVIGAVVLAATMRSLDAQDTWQSGMTLWERAVASNPDDGTAWSMYTDALLAAGRNRDAYGVLREGLRRSRAPRLLLRKALLIAEQGQPEDAIASMRDAAEAGEPRAMSNLALLLLDARQRDAAQLEEALRWARRGAAIQPMYAAGHRTHGKVALAARQLDEALTAFERAFALEPQHAANRYNLGLALAELGRVDEARVHFEEVVDDERVGGAARAALVRLRARPSP